MTGLRIARGLELPLDLVTEATAIVATRGAGKSSASAVVVEESFALGVQSVIFDRTGVYWGLRSNKAGDGPGLPIYVLGGAHGDVPLEPGAGVMIADLVVDSGHSFVLDLSDFSKAAAFKFAADFLERLDDRKARARTTTLVVMDEAHFYAPQTPRGGFKGDAARLMGAMEDMVGLGRSRGLGVVLTTQRTQSLNKAVLDLIETLLVMRMLSPRARDAVQDWIREKHEDDRQGVIATLESLPTGTAWVWSPLRGILEKVALRRIKTFDSYDTPKPGQVRVEPSARKELDLTKLGAEIEKTAERAKENDPAELRKRIRDLERSIEQERRLAAREIEEQLKQREPETIVERVEVPVLDYERFLAIQDAIKLEPLTELLEQLQSTRQAIYEGLERAVEISDRKEDTRRDPVRPPRPAAPPAAPRPAPPLRPAPRTAAGDRAASGDAAVSGPQQRILNALAWFEAIGVFAPKRTVTAAVAGVSSKSSGFRANVSTLSGLGLVAYPDGGRLTLTDAGRAVAEPPPVMPSQEDLHDAVCRMISGPQATLLRALIDRYAEPMSREELAEAAGVSVLSSGFRANVSTLSGFELIEYPSAGYVVAASLLFPGDSR